MFELTKVRICTEQTCEQSIVPIQLCDSCFRCLAFVGVCEQVSNNSFPPIQKRRTCTQSEQIWSTSTALRRQAQTHVSLSLNERTHVLGIFWHLVGDFEGRQPNREQFSPHYWEELFNYMKFLTFVKHTVSHSSRVLQKNYLSEITAVSEIRN